MPEKSGTHRSWKRGASRWAWVVLLALLALTANFLPTSAAEPAPPDVIAPAQSGTGYVGPVYGSAPNSTPTGEKPESKLWWNDGRWWGAMFSQSAGAYRILWLNQSNMTWQDSGTSIGNRDRDKVDVLWDQGGQKLYVASHAFSTSGSATSSNWAQLFRFSYNSGSKTYSADAGFPVDISRGRAEALTIDKDSTGRLWTTYVESNKVMINHSTTNDQTWATPFQLPGSQNVTSDDISAVIAFGGNKIGVAWSDQSDDAYYFAIHNDGAAPTTWTIETGIQGNNLVDDHISLATDNAGRIYLAGKTSLTGNNPLAVLDVRGASGGWSRYVYGMDADGHTRPIVVVDSQNQKVHMFATSPESSGDIYLKTANMGSISFPSGKGTVFIHPAAGGVNNATSTKQQVNSATGLVVLASNSGNQTYYFNYMTLGGGGGPSPTPTNTPTNTPTSTPTGTVTVGPSPTATNTPTNTPTSTPTNTPTHTPTTTPPPSGQLIFSPLADTHVKTDQPTKNYGTLDHVRVRLSSGADYDSYFKFVVSGTGGAVQSAVLRLFTYDGGPDGGTLYLASNNYLGSGTPWTETGLTWNNAPGAAGSPVTTAGNVLSNTWVELNVTSAITGDGTYSFMLTNDNSNSVFYYAKEAANLRPELIVYTSGGPVNTPTHTPTNTPTDTPAPGTTPTHTPTATNTPVPSGSLTLAPIADTHVKTDRATSNYGSDDYVRLRQTAGVDYDSYFKFDVSGTGGQVSNAILWLYSYDGGPDGGTIYTTSNNYLGTSTPWTESGLTWNNAPGMEIPLYTVSNVANNSWAAWDVTWAITGDGIFSFGLSNDNSNSVFYYSKEAANFQPRLEIQLGGNDALGMRAAPMVQSLMAAPEVEESIDIVVETPAPEVTEPVVYSLPYGDNFESGTGWLATGAWQHDALAGLNSGGWFGNSSLRGQSSTLQLDGLLDLSTVLSPTLTFWQKAALTAGDRVLVEASADNGLTWLALSDEFGAVSEWTQRSVDLSAVSGQLVALRFHLDTTGELPSGSASLGLWLDDVAVNLIAAEPPAPPTEEPVIEPPTVEEPAETPTETPADDPAEVPTEVPTDEPTEEPIDEPAELPTEEPGDIVLPSVLLTVESDDPAVLASGAWVAHDTVEASGARYVYSSGSLTDTLSLAFTGTQVDVVFVLHPALGSFAIEIDGVQHQIVNSTGTSTVFGARTSVTGLADGPHTLRIVPTSGTIAIDAFAVAGLGTLAPVPPVVEPPVVEPPAIEPPVVEPPAVSTEEPTEEPPALPQPTATPLPVLLPYFDSFEVAQTWLGDGSWLHAPTGGYAGGGWFANANTGGQVSTLTLAYQIDLRAAVNPQLTYWQTALLQGDDLLSFEVSVDGGLSWLPVDAQKGWNGAWASRSVDLSGFRGTVLNLRFVLTAGPSGAPSNLSSLLGIDDLSVQEVITPTVTPTVTPLSEPLPLPPAPPDPSTPAPEASTGIVIEVIPAEEGGEGSGQ